MNASHADSKATHDATRIVVSTPASPSHDDGLYRMDPNGAMPSKEIMRKMYAQMLTIRLWDERALKLQRSGRISFCVTHKGEEATQIGTVAALRATDWVFPAYRQLGVPLWRGASLEMLANQLFGNEGDISKGRQMPCHYSFHDLYFASVSSVIGTQIVHAAGAALAAMAKGSDDVAVTYFGDGASSANDLHSALTFAGAFKLPALFFCVNNHYAISLPVSAQTGANTLADKGIGYGIDSIRVDGNDVLAVYQATLVAAENARQGNGSTLLELVTYRMHPHSSSDDDGRYRIEGEMETWIDKDPIPRFEQYLEAEGILHAEEREALKKDLEAQIQDATSVAHAAPAPNWQSMVEDVYAEVPAPLQRQLDEWIAHESELTLANAGAFPL